MGGDVFTEGKQIGTTATANSNGGSGNMAFYLEGTVTVLSDLSACLHNGPVQHGLWVENSPYTALISNAASDVDNDLMTFSKVSGPAWLNVSTNGILSGTPGAADVGAERIFGASHGRGR